ncbi:cell wall hydrolase [Modicisalibacter muralis]|nr:cell wall hydrolase [Halomonas muralis]
MNQAFAIEPAPKSEVAVEKAEVLQQSVVIEGGEAPAPSSVTITQPEVQAVDPSGEAPLDDAITCLARTIYWEARGERVADMQAVANVVMNRLGHEGFPDTVCGVVKQGSEQGTCQFSWWCDGRADDAQAEDAYAVAKEIARKALNGQLPDRTGGALYFHHREVAPDWGEVYRQTAEVGEFVFYKPWGGTAQ